MSISGRVLVIDQLNLFLRNYVINPAESQWGPIGGVRGTLQSLQKLCNEVKPDHIVICWDGAGGSIKRKQMKKDYKAGRAPIRLNRAFHHLDEDETKQNRFFQEETRKVIIPSYFFEKKSHLSYNHKKYPIPFETEQYLAFRYGETWRVADSKFYFFDDDKSVTREPSLDP